MTTARPPTSREPSDERQKTGGHPVVTGVLTSVGGAVATAVLLWGFGVLKTEIVVTSLPDGAVVAFRKACPPRGWTPYELAEGRYIVGVPNGTRTEETRGTALSYLEDRPVGNHAHIYKHQTLSGDVANGLGAGGYDRRVQNLATEPLRDAKGADLAPGTNAPYVQLVYCEKDKDVKQHPDG